MILHLLIIVKFVKEACYVTTNGLDDSRKSSVQKAPQKHEKGPATSFIEFKQNMRSANLLYRNAKIIV